MAAVTVYAVILAWRGQRMKRLPSLIGALALGLGLSAFYWLPALVETRFTQMETTMFSGLLAAANNLTTLRSLVQPALVFDYWGPLRFHLALWQAVLGGLRCYCCHSRRQGSASRWPCWRRYGSSQWCFN